MVIKSANRQIRIPKYREFPGSQWSGLHTFTAEVSDSIPSQGNKIPQALQHSLPPPPPGKSGLHARGEGERVLALESREGHNWRWG